MRTKERQIRAYLIASPYLSGTPSALQVGIPIVTVLANSLVFWCGPFILSLFPFQDADMFWDLNISFIVGGWGLVLLAAILMGLKSPFIMNLFPFQDADMFWDFISLRPETSHQVAFLFSDRGTPYGYRYTQPSFYGKNSCEYRIPPSPNSDKVASEWVSKYLCNRIGDERGH